MFPTKYYTRASGQFRRPTQNGFFETRSARKRFRSLFVYTPAGRQGARPSIIPQKPILSRQLADIYWFTYKRARRRFREVFGIFRYDPSPSSARLFRTHRTPITKPDINSASFHPSYVYYNHPSPFDSPPLPPPPRPFDFRN